MHAISLDVTKDDSVNQALTYVKSVLKDKGMIFERKLGNYTISGLHGLVNNAGIAGLNAWDDWTKLDSYRMCWEVNTLGLIRMTHTFKPLIKKAKFVFIGLIF